MWLRLSLFPMHFVYASCPGPINGDIQPQYDQRVPSTNQGVRYQQEYYYGSPQPEPLPIYPQPHPYYGYDYGSRPRYNPYPQPQYPPPPYIPYPAPRQPPISPPSVPQEQQNCNDRSMNVLRLITSLDSTIKQVASARHLLEGFLTDFLSGRNEISNISAIIRTARLALSLSSNIRQLIGPSSASINCAPSASIRERLIESIFGLRQTQHDLASVMSELVKSPFESFSNLRSVYHDLAASLDDTLGAFQGITDSDGNEGGNGSDRNGNDGSDGGSNSSENSANEFTSTGSNDRGFAGFTQYSAPANDATSGVGVGAASTVDGTSNSQTINPINGIGGLVFTFSTSEIYTFTDTEYVTENGQQAQRVYTFTGTDVYKFTNTYYGISEPAQATTTEESDRSAHSPTIRSITTPGIMTYAYSRPQLVPRPVVTRPHLPLAQTDSSRYPPTRIPPKGNSPPGNPFSRITAHSFRVPLPRYPPPRNSPPAGLNVDAQPLGGEQHGDRITSPETYDTIYRSLPRYLGPRNEQFKRADDGSINGGDGYDSSDCGESVCNSIGPDNQRSIVETLSQFGELPGAVFTRTYGPFHHISMSFVEHVPRTTTMI